MPNYKPFRIFQQAQSTIAHKLFGEFDLEDFPVNQAKDGFVWDDGLEDAFIEELYEQSGIDTSGDWHKTGSNGKYDFVLKGFNQMEKIYNMCRAVYRKEISDNEAILQLQGQVGVSNASLKMYFTIYTCMRLGKAYKMGTSEAFTHYLLEHIYVDDGIDAFKSALSAVKGNAAYRESVNNAQPGLERACFNAIKASGEEIEFEDIPVADYQPASSSPDSKGKKAGTEKMTAIEISSLQNSSSLRNADFANTIMGLAEIYQFLNEEDIALLSNRS